MTISDFERLLAAALPARGRLAITLTDPPAPDDLPELLDRAMLAGDSCGAPLVEIHAPRTRYGLDSAWRHVVVTNRNDVIRLVFDSGDEAFCNAGVPASLTSAQAEFSAGHL